VKPSHVNSPTSIADSNFNVPEPVRLLPIVNVATLGTITKIKIQKLIKIKTSNLSFNCKLISGTTFRTFPPTCCLLVSSNILGSKAISFNIRDFEHLMRKYANNIVLEKCVFKYSSCLMLIGRLRKGYQK